MTICKVCQVPLVRKKCPICKVVRKQQLKPHIRPYVPSGPRDTAAITATDCGSGRAMCPFISHRRYWKKTGKNGRLCKKFNEVVAPATRPGMWLRLPQCIDRGLIVRIIWQKGFSGLKHEKEYQEWLQREGD